MRSKACLLSSSFLWEKTSSRRFHPAYSWTYLRSGRLFLLFVYFILFPFRWGETWGICAALICEHRSKNVSVSVHVLCNPFDDIWCIRAFVFWVVCMFVLMCVYTLILICIWKRFDVCMCVDIEMIWDIIHTHTHTCMYKCACYIYLYTCKYYFL